MKQIFFLFLITPFLYINYKILVSDIQKKIIPNKYLLSLFVLLPFFYIFSYFFGYFDFEVHIIWAFFFSLFISFWLYYYWLWSAGDAKYLLILSLYLWNTSIIYFIGNIAIITVLYLLVYCIYFYVYKLPFYSQYRSYIITNIQRDLQEKVHTYFRSWNDGFIISEVIKKIIRFFLLFLTLFVALRLIRMYLIDTYIWSYEWFFLWYPIGILVILWLIITFVWWIFFLKIWYFYIQRITLSIFQSLQKSEKIQRENIDFFFTIVAFLTLVVFVGYEFQVHPQYIWEKLRLIFSFYILIYICFIVLRYLYIITFQLWELSFIPFLKLKAGEIVDIPYLLKLIGNQVSPYDLKSIEYIKNLNTPIDTKECKQIQQIFKKINTYHLRHNTPWFHKFEYVKTLNTFAFWGYIFWGYVLTFFFWEKLFSALFFFLKELADFILR